MLKKFLIAIAVFTVATIIGAVWFYNSVKNEVHNIIDHKMEISSVIFDKNMDKIANITGKEFRLYVEFKDIPTSIVEALLAIEDTTFFEHNGINIEAIFRAIFKDVLAMKMVEGASTITQQFVRNTVLTKKKTLDRKLKEVFLSLEVEQYLSKEQILERYLNKIYFGRGFYGIRTASLGYFHKELDALTLKEVAILIGLIKAPSFYDPTRNYEHSIGRANRVITRMYEGLSWIGEDEFKNAITEKPKVFKSTKTENVAPYITDYVIHKLIPKFPDLRTGGYAIFTTIDLEIQKIARESLQKGYKNIVAKMEKKNFTEKRIKELNGGILSLNQKTGNILAMVGGVDYSKSQFNRVTQANRQIGSSIKPFFYQVGLNLGFSGASLLNDIQKTYSYKDKNGNEKKWKPQNYSKRVKGKMTLRNALTKSRNLATIDLVNQLGANHFYSTLNRYGFKGLPRNLSTALGSYTTTMFKLSYQYTILSNYGMKIEPVIIRKVTQHKEVVYTKESAKERLNSEKQAYLIIDIMKDVIRRGSGKRSRIKGLELAGKTGTTNKGKDVWFNVFSPDYQTHIWYGNDNSTPIFDKGASSSLATPVGKFFFTELAKIRYFDKSFRVPRGVRRYKFNGVWENFTNISKPPITKIEVQDSLLF